METKNREISFHESPIPKKNDEYHFIFKFQFVNTSLTFLSYLDGLNIIMIAIRIILIVKLSF